MTHPEHASLVDRLGEGLVVDQVVDEYAAYPSVARPREVRMQEAALARRADLVVVSSPELAG